ncbi:MAG: transposase [Eubacterium sp.]|nr:transposase [Eubacterium sp.]
MARQQRAKSESGIYHIMLRGINKQQVFFDDDDYYMFLNVLSKAKTVSGFKLYAYCLMNNHIHLLIEEGVEPLSKAFMRIGDSFIYRYNNKYNRIGGVFQGRYKSIPVNDDEYFISVLRYIHQNPVKAGLVNKCDQYKFSSYNEYFKSNSFVNTGFAIDIIGINEFVRIHNEQDASAFHMDIDEDIKQKRTNEDWFNMFVEQTHCKTPEEFSKYPKDMQLAFIGLLKTKGMPIRKICDFTHMSFYSVQKQ